MHNSVSQFKDAIASAGLTVPEVILTDGKLHRFSSNGKPDDKAGWYVFHHDDLSAGIFGCWRTGMSQTWKADIGRKLTLVEEATHRAKVESMKKQYEADKVFRQSQAAKEAKAIWDSAEPATEDHAYIRKKGIKTHSVRVHKDSLIVPVRDGNKFLTLQYVHTNGTKRFLPSGRTAGGYFSIGRPEQANILCITEGFATGASVHEATGYPVAVAFNAGNLEPVARSMRERFPDKRLVICADDDYRTEGNPGINKATEAVKAINGIIAIPDFGEARPDGATDFNDLHQHKGLEAVQECLKQAIELAEAYGTANSITNDTASNTAPEKTNREVMIQRATDIAMKPIDWLWHEWLPAGKLTILAGAAGTGKTTLALGIAAAVTANIPFPDGSKARERGNILIWSSEDAADDTLVPRLLASGADPKRCYFVQGVYSNGERLPFDPAKDIPKLDATAKQIGGISLLIVDPIISAVSGDMNKANEVRRSLQALVDFGERNSCAILGITHFTKGSAGKSPQERVLGSQAFSALARMVWVAANEEGSDRRVLARSKSNIAPDDGGFEYSLKLTLLESNITASHVVWGGQIEGTSREILGQVEYSDDGEGGALGDAKQFLHDLLADGPLTTKQIKSDADGAGYSWATVRRAKDGMGIEAERRGEPGKKGGGTWYWELPEKDKLLRCSRQDEHLNIGEFEHLNQSQHSCGFPGNSEGEKALRCSTKYIEHLNQNNPENDARDTQKIPWPPSQKFAQKQESDIPETAPIDPPWKDAIPLPDGRIRVTV